MNRIRFSLALLLLSVLLFSPHLVDAQPTQPHIRLNATASKIVLPDRGVIQGSFETSSHSLDDAQSSVITKAEQLAKLFEKLSIDESLNIDSVRVYPVRSANKGNHQTNTLTYRAVKSFSIQLTQLDSYPQISKVLFDAGVERIQPMRLEITNIDAIRQSLVKEAIVKAHAQAQEIAAVSGQKVLYPYSVDVSGHYSAGPQFKMSTLNSLPQDSISPGKQRVEASVSVVFIVE